LDIAPAASRSYDAHRVTASWAETGINWDNQPTVAGSATSTRATGTASDVWLSWDVKSDIEAFVAGTYSNYGWRIKDQVEDFATDYNSLFRTREYSDTTYDPQLVVIYQLPTLTLTYTAGANGTTSGTASQTVEYGGSGTAVTAVPDIGYNFVKWDDDYTSNPRTDTDVISDISVTSIFAINTYTLTYNAGANGSIDGLSPQTVNYGYDGAAVTAVPDIGYHFVNWGDGSTANPRTDTDVTADISVTANFAINTYTLTYTAGLHGLISGTTPQTVNYGDDGTSVTAVPDSGYNFVNWSDGSTDNPRTDTNVTGNISVTANFGITVTLSSVIDSYVDQSLPTNNYGTTTTMQVSSYNVGPNNRRSFLQFDISSISSVAIIKTATMRLYLDTAPAASRSYDAHRVTASWAETGIDWNNKPTVAGSATSTQATGTASGVWLSWDVKSDVTGFLAGTYSNYGWQIKDQVEDFATDYDSVFRTREYTGTTYDPQLVVTYQLPTYTLTYTAGANGSITGTSPQTVEYGGSGTAVTPEPDPGYHFVDWSGGSIANPRTDTNVTADISVTANFAINTYTLTYTAGIYGSISGTASQTVDYGGSGTAVEAIPDTGYHFVDWSDASTDNPRTDTNVTADISLNANFAINTFTVTTAVVGNGTCIANPVTVDYGSTSDITVTPAANHHIVSVVDSVEGAKSGSYTTTAVTSDRTVTATFAINVYTVIFQTDGTAGATLTGATTQMVNHGANCTPVRANAPTNYHFVKWTKGGVNYSTVNPLTVNNVTENMTLKAIFASGKPSAAKNWHLYE